MALFDFLKPKWSPGKMTEDDRARQFWLLKRKTSYTAWNRCREAYAAYVDLLERQCKEEPTGKMGPRLLEKKKASQRELIAEGVFEWFDVNQIENWSTNITKWTQSTYANALRGVALFDQGLALLKVGDRSVFTHTSQGLLEDACNRAYREYEDVYLGGAKGDQSLVFYGKYVPAMKAALQWGAEQVGYGAGGLQPEVADLSAPAVWDETRQVYDPIDKRKKTVIGSRDQWLLQTVHLTDLPPVPPSIEETFVRTGEACPVFGIYEAQVKEGLMVYMCQGQEAFRYGEPCSQPGAGQVITWTLVWEDKRYLDGVIPAEEADYFPGLLSSPNFLHFVGDELDNDWKSDDLVVAHTGELAVYTGRWAAKDDLGGKIYWRQGDPLPMNQGRPTDWVYSGG